ncbi:MAG TPA: hypothetical protein VME19_13740 [Streptosporangiaceae bacterium]|nr:hypothetical protein [Streptosporangiaceae bacterium]
MEVFAAGEPERVWHRWRWGGRDWLALGGAVSLDRAGSTWASVLSR